jgi:anaerobic ribonucleoside-triphosphate reductase activating protein
MRIAKVVQRSYVDGPGQRVALFVQGCPIHCAGCQNRHLWAPDGGTEVDVETLADQLLATGLPVTITGGEPFAQPDALAALLQALRERRPDLHVIVYSGYTLEQLRDRPEPSVQEALSLADVLVDGPYIAELDEPGLQYKGSTNQRAIDLQATQCLAESSEEDSAVVTLDWQVPELIITRSGDVVGTPAALAALESLGEISPHRRCGETREV